METQARKRRRRFSEQERKQLIAAWRESGMSAAKFSERAGVNKSNLWRWASEFETTTPPRRTTAVRQAKPRFIELRVNQPMERVDAAVSADGHAPLVDVTGPLGMRVRVYAGADVETLSRLLAALSAGARC